MADLEAFYRIRLKNEYDMRVKKNSRYSKSAFAKFLGIETSYLSKLLSGHILLSLNLADTIAKRLKFSEECRRKFLLSVADEQKCHSLYLLDPSLTECDPNCDEISRRPVSRKR